MKIVKNSQGSDYSKNIIPVTQDVNTVLEIFNYYESLKKYRGNQ